MIRKRWRSAPIIGLPLVSKQSNTIRVIKQKAICLLSAFTKVECPLNNNGTHPSTGLSIYFPSTDVQNTSSYLNNEMNASVFWDAKRQKWTNSKSHWIFQSLQNIHIWKHCWHKHSAANKAVLSINTDENRRTFKNSRPT